MSERETTSALLKVEGEIEEVAAEIKKVEKQLENKSLPKDKIDYLRKREEQLRKKEEQLRNEKAQLRKEKEQLREKEILILQQQQQQRVVHDASLADGVFVLYRGGDKDATPIGTAFAIASNLLLTACHNVVQKAEDGTFSEVTELKVALRLSRSSDSKIVADETGRGLEISKYNTAVDWACLRLKGGEAPLTTIIPLGTQDSDLPKPATPEKLWIYHCPVQLFLDDQEVEVCHVMVKEASVGLVGKKILNFQNGAFPGSCGGPYIFRNKAVALHVDSVSTTKTAEDLKNEGGETRSGRKRKLTDTEITQKMVDSCVSSHTSLGSGIILNVRSGIMDLLNGQYEL